MAPDWTELHQARRALLVVDVVESVRIMQINEVDAVARWMRFLDEVQTKALPALGGRLVKSYGDGFLLEFLDARAAMNAAFDLQQRVVAYNTGHGSDTKILLRMGLHVADVVVDKLDVYGNGVNLAARLASLAGPNEIVGSVEARDQLADGRDADIFDLGECFLKHYATAVRAYRLSTPGNNAVAYKQVPPRPAEQFPTIAVLPFSLVFADIECSVLGDALADDIIASLSQCQSIRVISRLSTRLFENATTDLGAVRTKLGATYVLSGSYRVTGGTAIVRVELCASSDGHILWADVLKAGVADFFHGQDDLVPEVALRVGREILNAELARARALPISTLDGYTLYVGSQVLLHKLARNDFLRARQLLDHLCERHPRSASPLALLAKWHVLNMLQGWAPDARKAGLEAQFCARRARELQHDHAFALSMDALTMAHLGQDLAQAKDIGAAATAANPQEPNAWLVLGGIHGYLGLAQPAEQLSMRAVTLSPMDPARFLFDVFVSAGKLTAGKYSEAADAARASIRLNSMHPASHRLLTIALALDGQMELARNAARGLLRLTPNFTVGTYSRNYAGRDHPHAKLRTDALLAAGLPA